MVIHKIYLTVEDFNLEITESVMKDFWQTHNMHNLSLREKCPNTEFFWSVLFRIRIEYGEIRSMSPYSVRMRENTDQKKIPYLETFYAVNMF